MKLNLKEVFFFKEETDKTINKQYKAHAFLNVGQALRDFQYVEDFPGAANKLQSIKNRAKSLALNLYYASIDPKTHHDDLSDLNSKSYKEWIKVGLKELFIADDEDDNKEEKTLDQEISTVPKPKDFKKHIPPFIKQKLDDKEFAVFEETFARSLNKLDYPKDKIILLLIGIIHDLVK